MDEGIGMVGHVLEEYLETGSQFTCIIETIMSSTLTLDIPKDISEPLSEAAREEGVSETTFAERALKDYLFLRRFRKLSQKMVSESEKPYSDEEIFELVS